MMTKRRKSWLSPLFENDAAPGVVLICSAALAMIIANSPWGEAFHDFLHHPVSWSPIAALPTVHHWINDGLMAVFFFVVGLEIKREILTGALRSPSARRLPVLAALAGMIVPALIYLATVGVHSPLSGGWAIPAATDIAFAMGVLALVGPGVPPALRIFLLTVAIVDDIGAVVIIAVFFTGDLDAGWLLAAAAAVAGLLLVNLRRVNSVWPYVFLTVLLWFTVLHSGIHATVAAVIAAFMVPLHNDRRHDSPLLRLEHSIAPWSGFVIVPLFGLANAGVHLTLDIPAVQLPLGIFLGLVVGKATGIFGAVWLAARMGLAEHPKDTAAWQMAAAAILCGIGFTMSLFIAGLAFGNRPELVEEAKLGILTGSLVSALAGYFALRMTTRKA